MEYEDIEIHISHNQHRANLYIVFAIRSSRGVKKTVTPAYTFSIPPRWANRLEAVLKDLNLRSTLGRAQERVKQLGEELFEQLFRDEVLNLYRSAKNDAERYKRILRLYFHITAPRLVNYPWEILRERNLATPICLSTQPKILLVRRTYDLMQARPLKNPNPRYSSPLRILGMASNVPDFPALNIKHEKSVIDEALEQLQQNGDISLNWKDGTTAELSKLKKDPSPWHVFHFIGHGHFDEQTGEGQLIFQDAENDQAPAYISAMKLSKELPATVPLIFLNACDTARGNNFERTSSVAYKLASDKRFAVIGMQFKVSDDAAIKFAQSFYTQLAHGKFIDEAVAEARQEIYKVNRNNPLDWAAPVLYTNTQMPFAFQQNAGQLPNTRKLPLTQLQPTPNLVSGPPATLESLEPKLTEIPFPPPRKTFRERYKALNPWQRLLCGVIALLLVCSLAFGGYVILGLLPNNTCNLNSSLAPTAIPTASTDSTASPLSVFANEPGMTIVQDSTGEPIGLSNGSTIFDQTSPADCFMLQAAQARQNGDSAQFDSSLNSAQTEDPANAEAKIYYENNKVLTTHQSYITIVLGITFLPTNHGGSRDILQGAYVAQKEYNDQIMNTHSSDPLLLLLLANSGSIDTNAAIVAQSIIQVQKVNKSIIGVVGWSLSSSTVDAINTLNTLSNSILMISPNATSDDLEGTPNVLRIVSSNQEQVQVAAEYAYKHAKKVAIFFQTGANYSSSLASDFRRDAPNPQSIIPIPYKTSNNFVQDLQDKVKGKADLIYFAGLAEDAIHLLDDLPRAGFSPTFPVMSGDGLAILNDYPPGQAGLNRLIFTTFAAIYSSNQNPASTQFVNEYQDDFNTSFPPHLSNGLNNLDSDVILSYEAVKVFLKGYQTAAAQTTDVTTTALEQALYSQTFPGLNGPITFQRGSPDPINSTVFIGQIMNGGVHIVKGGTFTCTQNPQNTPICSPQP